MPIISVIVPVYKVEAYLDRCVESILGQTFCEFELILVDDGSPDRCGAICEEYAKKDSRVKVLHKQNGGLSDARNAGVKIAQGEWIIFVDSDDYIHCAMLEVLYGAVNKYGVKVAACDYLEVFGEELPKAMDMTEELLAPDTYYPYYGTCATTAWGKLYHRSQVLPYPVGKIHEDEYVTYRILFAQERVAVLKGKYYGYFQNLEGITKSQWKPNRLDVLAAHEEQIKFFKGLGKTPIWRKRVWDLMHVLMRLLSNAKAAEDYESVKTLKKYGRKMLRTYWKDKIFWGEKDFWIYSTFYPKATRCVYYGWLVKRKLFRSKS